MEITYGNIRFKITDDPTGKKARQAIKAIEKASKVHEEDSEKLEKLKMESWLRTRARYEKDLEKLAAAAATEEEN